MTGCGIGDRQLAVRPSSTSLQSSRHTWNRGNQRTTFKPKSDSSVFFPLPPARQIQRSGPEFELLNSFFCSRVPPNRPFKNLLTVGAHSGKFTGRAMLVRRSIGIQGACSSHSAPPSSLLRGAVCLLPPLLAESLGGRLFLHASVVPAAPAMAENEAGSQQPAADVSGSNGASQPKELGKLAANIMPHLFNLYSLKATAADYEIYAPDATFEDPLMKAKGVKQIKSAFYSMPKIFSEGQIIEYDLKETETAPGSGEILIDNIQHYKVWGKAIDMKSLIKLQVENNKVIRHEDLWDKHPLWTKDTVRVPLVGRATEGWRRFNMIVTHTIMGCGKDPKPKN